MNPLPKETDILVIGGGINGAGVACDAAGRGLRVVLCEQGDLACATSSASSKLVHGGLRYLEHFEFKLVREALRERSLLLSKAPHLIHPLRFVLPHHPSMRPQWMLSLGLFLYDRLAKFDPRLARSCRLNLKTDRHGAALNATVDTGFAYSDCWVDDSRLVVANARAAADHGAHILTRTRVSRAVRRDGAWEVSLTDQNSGATHTVRAQALVNAAGPWTLGVLQACQGTGADKSLRLVKGSHMVVKRLYDGDHAYILQNDDGRVVFVIPYQGEFTLIGTTEVVMDAPPAPEGPRLDISAAELEYLCHSVNGYFVSQITPEDRVWSFAGVRPLFDDEAAHASAVTREYVLDLEVRAGAPLVSIFGGKLTTYRQLAEKVLDQLAPFFSPMGHPWTATVPLPGGDLEDDFQAHLHHVYPSLDQAVLRGLADRHGERTHTILKGATTMADLGQHFGGGLYACEVDTMMGHEWAQTVDDVLWRRSKLGLVFTSQQRQILADYMGCT